MKKNIIILVFILLSLSAFSQENKVFILCYHSFTGNAKNDYDISKDVLKEQIKILKDDGFKFVSYDEVKSGKLIGNKNILVTIDDGYLSSYEAYKEIMKPNGIKPIFAIYPVIIKDTPTKMYMGWSQVKELSLEPGVIIASHGYNHNAMSEKEYNKNSVSFTKEITLSKSILEEKLGKKIELFVYPYGINSTIAKELLSKAGYSMAFTIKWGTIWTPLSKNKDMYGLPRYMLTQKEWKNQFNIIKSNAK
jgi:peptidoglycan/xylan/chitin deacetylase (PgdA/CDA1 family)